MRPPKRATLTDVANEAGVSLKTASRVINGVSTVADQLRLQVVEAAQRLDYRPHRGAATMRSGSSDMIGMVIRDLGNAFYSRLAAGAAEEAEKHGCLVIISSSEGSPKREEQLLSAIFSQRPRGLLITPTPVTSPLVRAEADLGCPVVAIDEPLRELEADTVSFDNYGASKEAVVAAMDRGRSRFAILMDSFSLGTMEPRMRGALDALTSRGLTIPPAMVVGDIHTEEQARTAAASLLAGGDPPDAVFCANNVSALGAATEINERGLDVAVVSFDVFPMSAALPHPVITVEHDNREMGRTAAQLLFERLSDPHRPPQHVTIPTRLGSY